MRTCLTSSPIFGSLLLSGGLIFLAMDGLASPVFPIATDPNVIEISGGMVKVGTNYVVWYGSGTNILCQRISATGQLLGAPIYIGSNPGWPPAVAIVAGRTNCLVAWSDTSKTSGVTMFGRLIDQDGNVSAPFPLLGSVGTHGFQRVWPFAAASDGTNYLVCWTDDKDGIWDPEEQEYEGWTRVYGQFVSSFGTLIGLEFEVISGGDNREGAVCFGQINYLVAWQRDEEDPDGVKTYCRIISSWGALGPEVPISITVSEDHNPLALGFDGTNYLVVWNCTTNYDGPGELMLYGRLVSQAGVPLGSEIVISDLFHSHFPAIGFDGRHYLVIWSQGPLTNHVFRARFLDRNSNPVGPYFAPFAITNGALFPFNGVLFDGNRYLVTATFGAFIFEPDGGIRGLASADVYGGFLPISTTQPVFRNLSISGGNFQGDIQVVPGVTYRMEGSTNLTSWQTLSTVASDGTNKLHFIISQPVTTAPRMFIRAAMQGSGQ